MSNKAIAGQANLAPADWQEIKAALAAYKAAGMMADLKASEHLAGMTFAFAEELIGLAEIGWEWRENSALEKWFPITAQELAQAQFRVRALEAELDEFMRYHEEEVGRMFEISRDHGTAVVMFRVDRMQFMHLPAAELEARVKMVAVQTLEALLAGTPARETFDRLVRAWVQERMQKGGGA